MHLGCSHGVSAEKVGVDAISMDGFECAGHPGEDDIPNLVLLPCSGQCDQYPDARFGRLWRRTRAGGGAGAGLARGINMGTRFMATREAPIHDNVKKALVESDERATSLIFRTLRNTSRVYGNSVAKKAIEMEHEGKTIKEIGPIVAGCQGPRGLRDRRHGARRLVSRHGDGPDQGRADLQGAGRAHRP